jgi:hypothetical protein
MCLYPVAQIRTLGMVAWFQMVYGLIMIRICVSHVKFATPAYVIDQCERPFYEWMMISHSLRLASARHVQGTVHGTAKKTTLFDGHYLRNRSTFDIGVLGYIGIV